MNNEISSSNNNNSSSNISLSYDNSRSSDVVVILDTPIVSIAGSTALSDITTTTTSTTTTPTPTPTSSAETCSNTKPEIAHFKHQQFRLDGKLPPIIDAGSKLARNTKTGISSTTTTTTLDNNIGSCSAITNTILTNDDKDDLKNENIILLTNKQKTITSNDNDKIRIESDSNANNNSSSPSSNLIFQEKQKINLKDAPNQDQNVDTTKIGTSLIPNKAATNATIDNHPLATTTEILDIVANTRSENALTTISNDSSSSSSSFLATKGTIRKDSKSSALTNLNVSTSSLPSNVDQQAIIKSSEEPIPSTSKASKFKGVAKSWEAENIVSNLDDVNLKNLLDEAYSYKNPPDKKNKSKLFLELLRKAESEKEDPMISTTQAAPRQRQTRHSYSSSSSYSHHYTLHSQQHRNKQGGSLQDLQKAERNEVNIGGGSGGNNSNRHQNYNHNSRQKKYTVPASLVSSRQREGGSLPNNVNVSTCIGAPSFSSGCVVSVDDANGKTTLDTPDAIQTQSSNLLAKQNLRNANKAAVLTLCPTKYESEVCSGGGDIKQHAIGKLGTFPSAPSIALLSTNCSNNNTIGSGTSSNTTLSNSIASTSVIASYCNDNNSSVSNNGDCVIEMGEPMLDIQQQQRILPTKGAGNMQNTTYINRFDANASIGNMTQTQIAAKLETQRCTEVSQGLRFEALERPINSASSNSINIAGPTMTNTNSLPKSGIILSKSDGYQQAYLPIRDDYKSVKSVLGEKPDPQRYTDENGNSLNEMSGNGISSYSSGAAFSSSSHVSAKPKAKNKSKQDRNTKTIDVQKVAGYRGTEDVDDLVKFIENGDDNKTNNNNKKKDKNKKEKQGSGGGGGGTASEKHQKMKKSNSMENLSTQKLEVDAPKRTAATMENSNVVIRNNKSKNNKNNNNNTSSSTADINKKLENNIKKLENTINNSKSHKERTALSTHSIIAADNAAIATAVNAVGEENDAVSVEKDIKAKNIEDNAADNLDLSRSKDSSKASGKGQKNVATNKEKVGGGSGERDEKEFNKENIKTNSKNEKVLNNSKNCDETSMPVPLSSGVTAKPEKTEKSEKRKKNSIVGESNSTAAASTNHQFQNTKSNVAEDVSVEGLNSLEKQSPTTSENVKHTETCAPANVSSVDIFATESMLPETAEFHVVTKKKKTKKVRAPLADDTTSGFYKTHQQSRHNKYHNNSTEQYSGNGNNGYNSNHHNQYNNYQQLNHSQQQQQQQQQHQNQQPRMKNQKSRRKSTSSVPPSEKSESSDLDSVHSLPIESTKSKSDVSGGALKEGKQKRKQQHQTAQQQQLTTSHNNSNQGRKAAPAPFSYAAIAASNSNAVSNTHNINITPIDGGNVSATATSTLPSANPDSSSTVAKSSIATNTQITAVSSAAGASVVAANTTNTSILKVVSTTNSSNTVINNNNNNGVTANVKPKSKKAIKSDFPELVSSSTSLPASAVVAGSASSSKTSYSIVSKKAIGPENNATTTMVAPSGINASDSNINPAISPPFTSAPSGASGNTESRESSLVAGNNNMKTEKQTIAAANPQQSLHQSLQKSKSVDNDNHSNSEVSASSSASNYTMDHQQYPALKATKRHSTSNVLVPSDLHAINAAALVAPFNFAAAARQHITTVGPQATSATSIAPESNNTKTKEQPSDVIPSNRPTISPPTSTSTNAGSHVQSATATAQTQNYKKSITAASTKEKPPQVVGTEVNNSNNLTNTKKSKKEKLQSTSKTKSQVAGAPASGVNVAEQQTTLSSSNSDSENDKTLASQKLSTAATQTSVMGEATVLTFYDAEDLPPTEFGNIVENEEVIKKSTILLVSPPQRLLHPPNTLTSAPPVIMLNDNFNHPIGLGVSFGDFNENEIFRMKKNESKLIHVSSPHPETGFGELFIYDETNEGQKSQPPLEKLPKDSARGGRGGAQYLNDSGHASDSNCMNISAHQATDDIIIGSNVDSSSPNNSYILDNHNSACSTGSSSIGSASTSTAAGSGMSNNQSSDSGIYTKKPSKYEGHDLDASSGDGALPPQQLETCNEIETVMLAEARRAADRHPQQAPSGQYYHQAPTKQYHPTTYQQLQATGDPPLRRSVQNQNSYSSSFPPPQQQPIDGNRSGVIVRSADGYHATVSVVDPNVNYNMNPSGYYHRPYSGADVRTRASNSKDHDNSASPEPAQLSSSSSHIVKIQDQEFDLNYLPPNEDFPLTKDQQLQHDQLVEYVSAAWDEISKCKSIKYYREVTEN